MKNILLASDGSEHALRATKKAIELCSYIQKATVTVVYVINTTTAKTDVLLEGNVEEREAMRKKRLSSTEALLKEANIPYEIRLLRGEPGPAIVEFANAHSFDLVIVGSRGLNTLQEMVLGSVSHKVAKRVDAPVLIVK
ncbi:universal stress protein [Anoxybacillus gonensis]|uniref:universal stress protein n=1 Tax=Anoxybacillus gonensis TaxID=198467 RepID=UPI0002BE8FDD|nr:universal stress protein [Anoxybacillus gonensis]EMI09414.1 Universal stress protein [Anoxybacillus gonensis]